MRAKIVPVPRTKIHQLQYLDGVDSQTLAISTEDGRILFYATNDIQVQPETDSTTTPQTSLSSNTTPTTSSTIPFCRLLAELDSLKSTDSSTRIKDFCILSLPTDSALSTVRLVVTGSSDGSIRLLAFDVRDLKASLKSDAARIGWMLGAVETPERITCLKGFVLESGGGELGDFVEEDDEDSEDDEEEEEEDEDDEVDDEDDEDSEEDDGDNDGQDGSVDGEEAVNNGDEAFEGFSSDSEG